MFEPGKKSKELGIDTTRAFRVVKTYTFEAGDIIYFVKESDNMDLFGLFCKDKNIKEDCHSCHWMPWNSLEYAEEYRPEFRVGDTVEKQNANIYDIIANGIRGEVIKILLDTYLVRWFNGREFYYDPKYLKLFSRAEEPKTEESRPLFSTSHYFNEENLKKAEEMLELYENNPMQNYWCGKSLTERMVGHLKKQRDLQKASLEENLRIFNKLNSFNKPNKKTFMNNIVEFAKNQALKATNPDEFDLRTAGLKDQEGNWTAEAIQIVKDLKAQQLGFKDASEAVIKTATAVGICGVSFIEANALFIEFAADLLKIAQEKLASEAKK